MLKGRLFDGETARPRPVALDPEPDALVMMTPDGPERLAWGRLRRARDGLALMDVARPDWRVKLDQPLPADWAARITAEGAADARDRRQLLLGVVALLGFGLSLWQAGDKLLDWAAPRLPQSLMAPLGAALVKDLGPACTAPAGTAAAKALLSRLTPAGGLPQPVTLTIIDRPVVNAMALPGGQVVLFRQLIEDAAGPDELAGVLAHELAHVAARDPARGMVRHFGLSVLLQSVGGRSAGMADELLLLSASRETEARADAGAISLLRAANLATAPTAAFFERESGASKADKTSSGGNILTRLGSYASSHPEGASRAAAFRAADTGQPRPPALSRAQWLALRSICTQTSEP